jgi:hypothetical protein
MRLRNALYADPFIPKPIQPYQTKSSLRISCIKVVASAHIVSFCIFFQSTQSAFVSLVRRIILRPRPNPKRIPQPTRKSRPPTQFLRILRLALLLALLSQPPQRSDPLIGRCMTESIEIQESRDAATLGIRGCVVALGDVDDVIAAFVGGEGGRQFGALGGGGGGVGGWVGGGCYGAEVVAAERVSEGMEGKGDEGLTIVDRFRIRLRARDRCMRDGICGDRATLVHPRRS